MARKTKSLGDKIQKKFHDAADAVKDAVDDVDLPDIKVPNKVKNIIDKDEEGTRLAPSDIDGAKVLSTESALKLIYYMMAVNGEILQEEEEKFDLIGKELDPAFTENRGRIVKTCRTALHGTDDQNDNYTLVKKGVAAAIRASKLSADSFITPKLLIWDLLSVAYSDDHYDDTEKKLIRYIVKKLNVNEAEFLEMESSFLTLMDIQGEMEWIKTTDRPYKTIEAIVNELADRKAVILDSVNDLITL